MTVFEEFWARHTISRQQLLSTVPKGLSNFWRNRCIHDYKCVTVNIKDYKDMGSNIPRSPSLFRPNGLALWDVILSRKNPIEHRPPKGIQSIVKPPEYHNRSWVDPLYTNERKRYSYNTPIFLNSYIDFNQLDDGFELYEAAHVLTHLWADPVALYTKENYRRFIYDYYFNIAVAHIMLSHSFNIPIYIKEAPSVSRWKVPSVIGLNFSIVKPRGEPEFSIPKKEALVPAYFDKTTATAFIAVYPQAQATKEAINKGSPDILFNMGPMRVLFVGWELMDFILLKAPTAKGYKTNHIVMHPEDMYSPLDFWNYIEAVNINITDDFMYLEDWLASPEYTKAYRRTPTLPCRSCLFQVTGTVNYIPKYGDIKEEKKVKKFRTEVFKATRNQIILYKALTTNRSSKVVRNDESKRNKAWQEKMTKLKERHKITKALTLELC